MEPAPRSGSPNSPAAGRLSGKTVLVTGAAHGIGRAIAVRLGAEGARIAAADLDVDAARQCAEEIRTAGGGASGFAVDTSERASIQALVHAVVAEFGSLDIAFNNAGVGHNAIFMEITEAQWDWMFAVNTKGVFLSIQEEARQMMGQGRGGKIINTASIAGRHGSAYQAHYSASKFAVIGLTQSAAKALAPHQITVNAINPGIVDTPMWQRTDGELAAIQHRETGRDVRPGEVTEAIRSNIPLGRIAGPDDVAALASFLASSDADYITGQAINVCGGLIMD